MKNQFTKITALLTALVLMLGLVCTAGAESVIDTIMTVGTTQAFSADPVPEADLRTIVQAGLASASAINQQPWYLVAVSDPEVISRLTSGGSSMPAGGADFGGSSGAPAGDFGNSTGTPAEAPADGAAAPAAPAASAGGSAKAAFGDSPAAIIIYMDKNTKSPNPTFDCGLAAQNMYLAAASLGYGVKIVTSPTMSLNGADHDAFCELLGVDPAMEAVAVLLIGVPDTSVDAASGATGRAAIDEKASIICG